MFIKLKTSTKDLLQIGYSKSEITVSETSETNEKGIVTITYDFGSGNSCIECTDEDVLTRLNQLDDYVKSVPVTGTVYNIKWSDSKVSAVTGQDEAGEDITIQTHFSGNDSDKNARLLADKWTAVRRERDRRLSQTDYLALSDGTLTADMTAYREALRDVPEDNADVDNITWPSK
jgi:hypothetical protein